MYDPIPQWLSSFLFVIGVTMLSIGGFYIGVGLFRLFNKHRLPKHPYDHVLETGTEPEEDPLAQRGRVAPGITFQNPDGSWKSYDFDGERWIEVFHQPPNKLYTISLDGTLFDVAHELNRRGWADYVINMQYLPSYALRSVYAVVVTLRMPREVVHELRASDPSFGPGSLVDFDDMPPPQDTPEVRDYADTMGFNKDSRS